MVTIAIPFYNAEDYLKEAIDSVLWQTYSDWKLILIDDGSNDNSLEIANKYKGIDERISVHSDGKNKNLGYRLNEISSLTDTEYLARMDADDIMHPEKIEKQMKVLLANSEIDVLGTNAYSINEKNEVVGIKINIGRTEIVPCKTFIHPTIIGKTQWFKEHPYNVNAVRIEDTELWMRSEKESKFMMLTEPLFFYREYGGGYYKKYVKSLPSIWKMAKVNQLKKSYINLYIRNCVAAVVYYIFNKLGIESKLIVKRNDVLLPLTNYKEYVTKS